MSRKPASLDASLLVRHSAAQGTEPLVSMTTMSVRIDAELHRRLRLLSAHTRRSQRDILRAAIEQYLSKSETSD